LPQLIGLAFGVPEEQLLFKRHMVPVGPALAKVPA
jgi:heterodisulfide reductase subunit B